ncbi:MAG TPA: alanine racemase [Thermomicrobiales bacterium]|nr:alanine racemase [Thermomicrobiales bacterium]
MALPSEIDIHQIRATRAVVDLDAIEGNVRALRSALPESAQLMAVVKADGYGHGAPLIAGAALEAGAALLGVATVGEGQVLRSHGLRAPIVLLGSIDAREALTACETDLEITVASGWLLDSVQQAARAVGSASPIPVHLKVDTGLRRYGTTIIEAVALATRIASDPYLRFASIFTHFASADEPAEPFTEAQIQVFEQVVDAVRAAGVRLPPLHAANSAGILTGRGTDYGIARAGIALYGVPPAAAVPLLPGMRAGIRVESRITRVVDLVPGDTVGYNRTFHVNAPMRGALVPIGYADGYRRALSGCAWVGVDGRRAPVIGRVSMDQIVVAVPEGAQPALGDVVAVMGGDPESGAPSIEEMADLMGTNTYEVLVGIRGRVPRVFLRDGKPVAARVGGATANWIALSSARTKV